MRLTGRFSLPVTSSFCLLWSGGFTVATEEHDRGPARRWPRAYQQGLRVGRLVVDKSSRNFIVQMRLETMQSQDERESSHVHGSSGRNRDCAPWREESWISSGTVKLVRGSSILCAILTCNNNNLQTRTFSSCSDLLLNPDGSIGYRKFVCRPWEGDSSSSYPYSILRKNPRFRLRKSAESTTASPPLDRQSGQAIPRDAA